MYEQVICDCGETEFVQIHTDQSRSGKCSNCFEEEYK
jgi:hypothetical protein